MTHDVEKTDNAHLARVMQDPHAFAREKIAAEVRRLAEPAEHARVRAALAAVKRKLGGPGASRRAAEAIMASVRA